MWKKLKSLGWPAQDLVIAMGLTAIGLSLGIALSALTGCTPAPPVVEPAPQVVQAQPAVVGAPAQPVVIVQQPAAQQNSGAGDFMMGALVGHALSGGGGPGYYHAPAPVVHQTTVVNKTVNVTKVAPQPRAYVAPRSSYSPPRRR